MDKQLYSESYIYARWILWTIEREFYDELSKVKDENDLNLLRTKYLGKSSVLAQIFRALGTRREESEE
jgi:hypothetical protein